VDAIRALNEGASTLPFESPYKVYIIDEVHMLSKPAFNALLKTLEEPPKHVIFILATTEMEKLPETVISRCQNFLFKKPTVAILTEVVERVAKKEGLAIERSSSELIALLGDGSFRDTQGMLEKVISAASSKRITHEEVEKITGAPPSSMVNQFITALNIKNPEAGIKALEGASRLNIDMKLFLKLVLMKVRSIVLLKYAPTLKQGFKEQYSESDYAFIVESAETKNLSLGSKTLIELINAAELSAYAHEPTLPLELALIHLSELAN
jgi:DNA polymerase-3 subunit gamma/tau